MNPTSTKKRVLLLPSYWPTHNAPVVGAQVHEQAQLLSDEFEFKVFFCLPGMGWKRYCWQTLVRLLTGRQLYWSCKHEFLADTLDAEGVYYFRSKWFSYKKNRKLEFKAYAYLTKRAIDQGWKPQLIHTRSAEYAGVNAARLSAAFDIPMLLTENVFFVLTDNLDINRIKDYQYAIESADTVAVVSNYVKALLLTNNFRCNPVTIGNWIDENRFKPAAAAAKTENPASIQTPAPHQTPETPGKAKPFTVLNIGHTGFTKDWPTFFKAMQYLVGTLGCTNIRILLAVTHVFDEESRGYVQKMAAEYGLSDYCEIFFQVPRAEIISLYHQSSVFVSTSINETFGIATCEAMFCGVPVIATANGGIDDIMTPVSGVKVDIGDHLAVAAAIKEMIDGEKIYDSAAIRASVISKFGTAAFKKRLIAVYNKTMEL